MKKYEKINIGAEKIAERINKNSQDVMPSLFSLIKWTEKELGLKMTIFYPKLENWHSGFVYFDPTTKIYKIGINSSHPECRQRFTMCHEIAHIIKNSGLAYELQVGDIYTAWGEERFCNRFAAAFLMPPDMFIQKWKTIKEPQYLKKARLASLFRVSGDAVHIRARELKLIE